MQVLQGLAKFITSDGEGATCLVEMIVAGASDEAAAATVARSVAASSLNKAATYGRDPNWGRICPCSRICWSSIRSSAAFKSLLESSI